MGMAEVDTVKRLSCLAAIFISVLLFTGGNAWSASPRLSAESTANQLISRADKAFRLANYKQSAAILRQAITESGHKVSPVLWNKYRLAVLARAGDDYLSGVPKNRYRVPVAVFGRDYQKEGIRKYFLLDVRQPEEFVKSHIAGALNVPFRQVLRHLAWLPGAGSDKVILIICRSQHRANHVLVVLRELGYTNAYTLQGGYHAYRKWLQKNPLPGAGSTPSVPPKADDEEDFSC
ncbi:hypothetical protein MNBD_DELTA03-415 [hydrothermal vent metagenome]|uniref:Rhodanese domain-containing protein n=1 Tax=hydrothermal vent metagenome TaxID=652676 RepID=A0A3B0W6I2_9ZZZZ